MRHHRANFSSNVKAFLFSWGALIVFLIWGAATFVFFAKLDHGSDALSFAAVAADDGFSAPQKTVLLPPTPIEEQPTTESFRPLHLFGKEDVR